MLGGVFISYRREDTAGFAGRIYDRLSRRLGRERVFIDVANIQPGLDFVEVLSEKVGACDALIALIGRDWVSSRDKDNRRRIDDPHDFVRIEIEAALERNVRVIPVLVEGVAMPRPEDLPESLKRLSRRQGIEISHARFDADVRKLTHALSMLDEELSKRAGAERAALEEHERNEAAYPAEKADEARRLAEAEAARRVDEERVAQEAAEAERAAREERERREAAEAREKAERERRLAEAEAARRAEEERRAKEAAEAERTARAEREKREAAEAAERAERERRLAEAARRAEEERRARESQEAERTAKQARAAISNLVDGATSTGAIPRGGAAPDQPAQNLAGASSGKNWRVAAAVAGLAVVGAAMLLLAENGNRQVNTPIVESNPPIPPPSNDGALAPAPPASVSTAQLQASTSVGQTETSRSSLTATQERALKPGDSFKDCGDCPEMIVAPSGRFRMGSPKGQGDDDERPQHDVTIAKPFAVAKFALTFDEWDACAAHGDCAHVRDSGWGRSQRPAINVSWDDAQTYVKWLSKLTGKEYRLLSEAEYEYAARAGTQTRYPWGDDIKPNGKVMANCDGCGSQWDGKQTAPVGSFAANRFGLYDMAGNVWQWTEDCWHASYQGAPADGSAWTSGNCDIRFVRGGSWVGGPGNLRSASRFFFVSPAPRVFDLGFRVARTLSP